MAIAGPAVRLGSATTRAVRRWTEVYAVGFVLLVITYLNLRKNAGDLDQGRRDAQVLYGLASAEAWFDLAYAAVAVAILVPLIRHLRRPLPLIPASWVGKGQLLYVVFLWWMVVGNFDRALVGFAAQRLVTEGRHPPECAASARCSCCSGRDRGGPATVGDPDRAAGSDDPTCAAGLLGRGVVAIVLDWAIVRAHLRRSLRRPRQPAHPVRPPVDGQVRPALRRLRSGVGRG